MFNENSPSASSTGEPVPHFVSSILNEVTKKPPLGYDPAVPLEDDFVGLPVANVGEIKPDGSVSCDSFDMTSNPASSATPSIVSVEPNNSDIDVILPPPPTGVHYLHRPILSDDDNELAKSPLFARAVSRHNSEPSITNNQLREVFPGFDLTEADLGADKDPNQPAPYLFGPTPFVDDKVVIGDE